jgi:predicted  nucleic acid-binding Zn-ribbon protein
MNPQLEMLLEIQDLKSQRRELEERAEEREVEEGLFAMEIEDAVMELGAKIEEMEASLDPRVQSRYRRLAGRRGRAVVPVIRGTCYGCFVSVPTALASDADRNAELRFCESCGRFLYLID